MVVTLRQELTSRNWSVRSLCIENITLTFTPQSASGQYDADMRQNFYLLQIDYSAVGNYSTKNYY